MNQKHLFGDSFHDLPNHEKKPAHTLHDLSESRVQPGDPAFQINPYDPDQPFELYSQHKEHRSRIHRQKWYRKRRLRRLIVAVLPFLCVLTGLFLISIGICRYLEQDALLSVLLVNREPTPVIVSDLPADAARETYHGRLVAPYFYIGDQIGTLRLPSAAIEIGLFQGDREEEFQKGAGHYIGSCLPGQNGNILISAHRTSYFRNFEKLALGDLVYIETTYGHFTYRIDELRKISQDDQSIAADTPREQLTLYTCYPFSYIGNPSQRFVVICSLVESELFV